jgi:hypothetical protein
MNPAVLAIFIPTFFFVSITPGMCMTLALTMGMSIGSNPRRMMPTIRAFGSAARAARSTGVAITASPIHEGITMASERV